MLKTFILFSNYVPKYTSASTAYKVYIQSLYNGLTTLKYRKEENWVWKYSVKGKGDTLICWSVVLTEKKL